MCQVKFAPFSMRQEGSRFHVEAGMLFKNTENT
jgi:hypothetical protein